MGPSAGGGNPYNTLTAGTNLSTLATVVVGLMLTGPGLTPFGARQQYAVATVMNGLLSPFPHILELSGVGVCLPFYPRVNAPSPPHAQACQPLSAWQYIFCFACMRHEQRLASPDMLELC